jgi:hypothetical protein
LIRFNQYFSLILLLVCSDSWVFAQENKSPAVVGTTVSANIVEQVSFSKTFNSTYGSGALIFSFDVETTPSSKIHSNRRGSLSLFSNTGVITAAFFTFSGNEGYSFTVLFPPSPLLIHKGATELQVTSITSNPALGTDPKMIAGVYVSITPMNVTVNYN